jgi:hypothetical protein
VHVIRTNIGGPKIISAVLTDFTYREFNRLPLIFIQNDRRLIHLADHRLLQGNIGPNQFAFSGRAATPSDGPPNITMKPGTESSEG